MIMVNIVGDNDNNKHTHTDTDNHTIVNYLSTIFFSGTHLVVIIFFITKINQ